LKTGVVQATVGSNPTPSASLRESFGWLATEANEGFNIDRKGYVLRRRLSAEALAKVDTTTLTQ
jgi:hypothetical protein